MSENLEKYLTEEYNEEVEDDVKIKQNEPVVISISRATRTRNKPKKYGDFVDTSPIKRNNKPCNSSSDDEDMNMEVCSQKPAALFGQDDIGGQDIFKFKSRHTKHDLQNKVRDAMTYSPASTSTLKTPKKNQTSFIKVSEATPKHVADVIKKRIIREVESDSGESDFSGSSSDFVPNRSDDESESSGTASNSEEEESIEVPKKINKQRIVKSKSDKTKPKDSEYIVTPDNYFVMHSSKKITTSDHTLARLKNMNISEDMKESETCVSNEHQKSIIDLVKSYEQLFNKWVYVLSEDFNIILYGIGSKRSILHQFQMQKLLDMPCVVINGFFPSLTIKNILETIVIDLLENKTVPSNIGDVVNLIDLQLSENDSQLFLLIHNIDGPMLRNAKTQSVLANLSQLKNVHTIATIDHINAPLLWDHSKLSKFRFTWWDATTFLPYNEETSYENSLMTQRSGALQLSSLKSVYQSLTTNAKGIFNIIIEYQLENQKQVHYQGLPLRDLYSKAREQFLVSSDLALRAQLTEFLDHKLAKIKRGFDGSENLIIPIESALLQQFLEQNVQ